MDINFTSLMNFFKKETKRNSHMLHARASLYMSKRPKDQSGSQTFCFQIERLANISPLCVLAGVFDFDSFVA